MIKIVFLDTSFAIALSSSGDEFHHQAQKLARQIEIDNTYIVTTQAVLLEIGNALSKQKYREKAGILIESLIADPTVEIIPFTNELFILAFRLFQSRPDKEWGLVDCLSCIVMQRCGITDVLTTDKHFQQMGFRALLRE
ncbi:PIN domain-containing protein [Anabaena cylindrica UHCC 0172]|uniref:type II toxin-antitoxin system VapC family toxin n=1 Tax=Anabaena cylindrica TaxID=1165 RepID=UPI002B200CD1|nr:PIN domain-containing protein [Anabaena cylindrica]MEA5554099.1 PIN domain-containing protein [Anabaena cylindrica UHCC 0172]